MRLLGVVVVAVALTGTVAAQPAPPAPPPGGTEPPPADVPPPSPAEQAFIDGRALLEEGKPAEACAKFEASFKLDPDAPGTLLNLGLCNERLGKTATALGWFRRAQVRAAETGMTDYEDVAKNSTLSLSVRVPTIRIEITGVAPPGSTVHIGAKQIPDVELGKIELDPGPHAIELRMPGTATARADITLRDGDKQTVTLAAPPPPKAYVEIDRGASRRRLAYIVGGAGLVLWGGSLAVTLVARDNYHSSDHPADWRDAQQLARFGGTSLFIAGTAALAVGAYLFIKAPGVERVERTAVTPVVGTDQLGVAVHGAF